MHRAERVVGVFGHFFELVAVAAEPAIVKAFVNVAAITKHLPEFLHCRFVRRIGGANPAVIFDAERRERRLKLFEYAVNVRLDGHAARFGGALDVDAMFICACEHERIHPALPMKSRQRIGDQRRVSMADVRPGVGVVNRCRDVKGFIHSQ